MKSDTKASDSLITAMDLRVEIRHCKENLVKLHDKTIEILGYIAGGGNHCDKVLVKMDTIRSEIIEQLTRAARALMKMKNASGKRHNADLLITDMQDLNSRVEALMDEIQNNVIKPMLTFTSNGNTKTHIVGITPSENDTSQNDG